jgi:Anti-sigma factor NepR
MKEMSNLSAGSVELGPDIKVRVGRQLRVMYGEVMDQAVPDRCIEILEQLDDLAMESENKQ